MDSILKEEVLQLVAQYCESEDSDLDTLNKLCEIASITAQKKKNKLSETQIKVYNDTLRKWATGDKTPTEFKILFRGA